MVAPVSGPFVRYPTFPFADAYQRGYRQKMPIDRPLEYRHYWYFGMVKTDSWTTTSYSPGSWTKQADWTLSSMPDYARVRQHAYNRAYEKLRSKAMDAAGWAENLAQINKTRTMFNDRAVQLAKFVLALSKGKFDKAARILRTPRPSGVSHGKALSQNFLEYEYGLKPLLKDIDSSVNILTAPPMKTAVRSRQIEQFPKVVGNGGGFGSNPRYTWSEKTIYNGVLEIKLQATVVITSPNLLLANQLGLIDLALPWKLMPFSFVVDWFVNVEQVVSSMTDWYGVTLENPFVSEFSQGQYFYNYHQLANYTSGAVEGLLQKKDKEYVEFNRTMGIPGPSLVVKPFKGFSLNRGLQAMALVLSVFGR
jgi:hypothetical protein